MRLSEAIQDFHDCARHELGHTASTSYAYASWQRNFARWLAENGTSDPPVDEISANLIRRYGYHMSSRNLRPRTIRQALLAIRALFAYLVRMGAVETNPATEVRLPKKDAATRLLVTDEELVKLWEAAGRQRTDFRCVRDRAVLAVLIFCALRRKELLDLTVQHVNLDDDSLLVQQGKGQKSRTIYLCPEAEEALREWLALRETMRYSHDRLFATETRQPFGENSLYHVLEDVKAIAGYKGDPRIKPHSIRHAAATRLMRNGADIRSIQAWLGHAQLQTTAIYLHTDEQQCRKIAPLAGFQPQRPDTPLSETGQSERRERPNRHRMRRERG